MTHLDIKTMNLVHRGQCHQLNKHTSDNIDKCIFLSNILNEPKSQSNSLVSRILKSDSSTIIRPNKKVIKPTKSLPISSKIIGKIPSIKASHLIKPVTKTIFQKPQKPIKTSDYQNNRIKQFKTNFSGLKSKSVQNLSSNTKTNHFIRKNSFPNLNELKREQSTKTKNSFDAIKLLEFLLEKAKQNTIDSKNVTFDSLFNELNLMSKKFSKSKSSNLDSTLDIKLDQMENEIEILRTQLNQNTNKLFSSPKRLVNSNSDFIKASKDNEKIISLENELIQCNKKCQVLEYLLEQKNKQTEKYNFLFKEINDNLNMLLDEINVNESNFNQKRLLNANDSNNLRENLIKFQSKLRHHFRHDAYLYANDKFLSNIHEKDTLNTTSSNTLIDADMSFETLSFNDLVNQKNFYINDDTKDTSNDYIFNKNSKYYQSMIPNDLDDEYEDEYDDCILTMDDLSITTIQTSAVDDDDEDNDGTQTVRVNNYDEDFSSDLQKLDQKIFQVKKLLQSMKTS